MLNLFTASINTGNTDWPIVLEDQYKFNARSLSKILMNTAEFFNNFIFNIRQQLVKDLEIHEINNEVKEKLIMYSV